MLARTLDPEMDAHIRDAQWLVSFVTAGELWRWAETARWAEGRRAELDRWLEEEVVVLHSDDLISREWGRSSGLAMLRGLRRPDNDAWIAACCQVHGLPLATSNVKDFAYHVEHDDLVLVG